MNTTKQLLALLRFQMAWTFPFVMFLPLALGLPFLLQFFTTLKLGLLFASIEFLVHDLCSWLVPFIGVALLAPEAVWVGNSNVAQSCGLEFLLTRAVDRRLLLRARAIVFYAVILALPLAAYLMAWRSPALQLVETNRDAYRQVLERIPGSFSDPKSGIIVIPNGNLLLQSWRVWHFLCVAIGAQVIVGFIYPLKYRGYIFWGLFAAALIAPVTPYFTHWSSDEGSSPSTSLFFAFVAHQPFSWLKMIAALILTQFWSEHRFSLAEQ